MLLVLKLVHFFALMLGSAASIGNTVLAGQLAARNEPPSAIIPAVMAIFGRMGVTAIVLLWLTGLGMSWLQYGTLWLGWLFALKLLAAAGVIVLGGLAGRMAAKARATRTPPDPARIRRLFN